MSMTSPSAVNHRLVPVTDGSTVVCTVCGTGWDEPLRFGTCPARPSNDCQYGPEPPTAHHYAPDGMCHWCGEADRG
jgi:hypothetical protein